MARSNTSFVLWPRLAATGILAGCVVMLVGSATTSPALGSGPGDPDARPATPAFASELWASTPSVAGGARHPQVTEGSAADPTMPDAQCLVCHDRKRLDVLLPSGQSLNAAVDGETFQSSVHGRAGVACASCHTDISAYPHPEYEATTVRDLTIELNASCVRCHDAEASATAQGAHAAAEDRSAAPVCSDCHGAHEVQPVADRIAQVRSCQGCHTEADFRFSAHGEALLDGDPRAPTCATCHGSHNVADGTVTAPAGCANCHGGIAETYDTSVHGVAHAGADQEAAVCSDCHGKAHAVKDSDDPDAPTYPLRLPETCGACHGDPGMTERHGLANVYEQYVDSIHGLAISDSGLLVSATCSGCHGSHDIQPHDAVASGVFASNVMDTCGTCHKGIVEEYDQSVHGRAVAAGDLRAAVCSDCHTAHQIARSDTTEWMLDVVKECGTCHEESLTTYRDTFHGQVTALGFTRVARCSDCHGSHTIASLDEAASAVSADNVVETCRQCHVDANENFAQFQPHADSHDREADPTMYYTRIFMESLIIGVFGFFGLHTILWGFRSSVERVRARRSAGQVETDVEPVDEGAGYETVEGDYVGQDTLEEPDGD